MKTIRYSGSYNILGQTTREIQKSIENAAVKAYSFPFVFGGKKQKTRKRKQQTKGKK